MGAEEELKVGILTKRAQQIKSISPPNYKERVFVLTPTKLSYYEGNLTQRGKMKGSFDLSTITFVGPINDQELQGTDTFLVIHSECYLYCCAKNRQECNDWVQAIENACYDVGIYQQLQHKFHSKLYLRGKWQCCNATQKTAEGCNIADNGKKEKRTPLPKLPVAPPPSVVHRSVTALYNYEPIEKDDIALEAGMRYLVIDDSRPYWWVVRNECGTEGYVPSNYVEEFDGKRSDGLHSMSWFQPDMSRQRAEYLLLKDGQEGTFVVRKSSHESVIYSLSVLSRCGKPTSAPSIRHYHIKQDDDGRFYLSAKHLQNSVLELINYHKHNAGGLVTRLRQAPDYLAKEPTVPLFNNSEWEMRLEDLHMIKKIGSGQFGVVKLAKYKGKSKVAVKIMKQNAMREASFIEEAEVMTKLKHRNLVELYGVVTHERPICIVTEYMEEGCLLDYIRAQPTISSHPDILLDISCQVCDGMKYLESKNVIHRDLAARNCLVGKNLLVKVGDFGLARFVLDDEYTSSIGSKFPIKWSAPEVLNYTKFSSKSDVWAFGVLMWELFTGGKIPYPSLSNSEVVTKITQGFRLERPQNCPHDVFAVMKRTWHEEPEHRPSFTELMDVLLDIIDNINASSLPPGLWQGS